MKPLLQEREGGFQAPATAPIFSSMARLILLNPEFSGQSCELPDGRLTVGRSRRSQIILLDDSVSADHCEVLVYGTEVIVREHGSRNGVFVDGVRIKAQSGVCNGQRLRLGRVEGLMQIASPEGAEETAITAFHDHCRMVQRHAASSPAPCRLVVFTPNLLVSAADQTKALPCTVALPAAPSTAPDDHSRECTRGSARYWQTLLRLLHL
jgi:hypothetical protein